MRGNDAKCDPWGRALAGTMRYDETAGAARLYRLEATVAENPGSGTAWTARVLSTGSVWPTVSGWSGTAGPCTSSTAWPIPLWVTGTGPTTSPWGHLRRWSPSRVERGARRYVRRRDGMSVGGRLRRGEVRRYRPDGRLDTIVEVPVAHTTSVAFGGPGGDRLFITSAGGDGAPDGSGRGGLWTVDPGTSGPPATVWCDPLTGT